MSVEPQTLTGAHHRILAMSDYDSRGGSLSCGPNPGIKLQNCRSTWGYSYNVNNNIYLPLFAYVANSTVISYLWLIMKKLTFHWRNQMKKVLLKGTQKVSISKKTSLKIAWHLVPQESGEKWAVSHYVNLKTSHMSDLKFWMPLHAPDWVLMSWEHGVLAMFTSLALREIAWYAPCWLKRVQCQNFVHFFVLLMLFVLDVLWKRLWNGQADKI